MRCSMMFVTAVCVMFLMKLKWPKKKSLETVSVRVLFTNRRTCWPHNELEMSKLFLAKQLLNFLKLLILLVNSHLLLPALLFISSSYKVEFF